MPRIQPVDRVTAEGELKDTLNGVADRFGGNVPNSHGTIARSLPTLQSFIALSGALRKGRLNARLREQIAILTAERNGCEYCLSAHALFGAKTGLTPADIALAREASGSDAKSAAALAFTGQVIDTRGHVTDADLAAVRSAGFEDGDIIEIVGNVAMTIFTNLLNNVAQPDVDFPLVTPGARHA